jgi:hypothetical protein
MSTWVVLAQIRRTEPQERIRQMAPSVENKVECRDTFCTHFYC